MKYIMICLMIAIITMIAMIAIPLSEFIKKVDENLICEGCGMKSTCFCNKRIFKSSARMIDEFMLFSYYKVKNKCNYNTKVKRTEYIVYICFSMCLTSYTFYIKGFNLVGVIDVVVTATLLSLSVVDWKTQYIPLEMNGIVFICGLIQMFADLSNWLEYVMGLFAVSSFLYIVNKIGTPILRKKYEGIQEVDDVIGGGDIKLMAATGLLLGWKLNFLALGIGCVIGSIIHCILIKIKKSEAQFALGPYLSLGTWIAMLYGKQLISWYFEMMGVEPF